MKKSIVVALLTLLPCLSQAAVPVFADNFDANPYGLSTVPAGWTVSDGTVDVVGIGGFGFLCAAGGGMCIDLDGSSWKPGVLSRSFSVTAGRTYMATFDLAGSQRGGSDNLLVTFGSAVLSLNALPSNSPWQQYSMSFLAQQSGTATLSFANGGSDNMGVMLDNVSVQSVPEPEGYLMMLGGLGLMGAVARRRGRRSHAG